jgi:hypothetical protein
MRQLLTLLTVCASAAAFAADPGGTDAHSLYFAVEVRKEGRVVATPKLLGESGKPVKVERRRAGASQFDYRLVLEPTLVGGKYEVALDLTLPDGPQCHHDLSMLHGQVRKFELGPKAGDLQVSLTLMRVDSPEFRALMDLVDPQANKRTRSSI